MVVKEGESGVWGRDSVGEGVRGWGEGKGERRRWTMGNREVG